MVEHDRVHVNERGHDAQRTSDTPLSGAAHPPHLHAAVRAELVAARQQPGASVAAVELQHGMNTNVLHRWLKEWAQGMHRF